MKKVTLKNTWLPMVPHGWGNGYVIIPKGHLLHGKHYDELNEFVDVHGGLTFSDAVDEEMLDNFSLDQSDLGAWAVGFDTTHYGDNRDNCNESYVSAETEKLLQQLLNLQTFK